ncbi:MAG: flotillin, partial [Mangrovimonas sp.]|nr:flotillin [Mangrovimonas sp.]
MLKLLALQVEGYASIIGIVIAVLFIFILIATLIKRYKRCPSDRILVVYGKVGGGQSAKCIHGGAAFIFPVIQDYEFLDLTPISIEVNLVNALSKQNIRVNVPSRFTIGVSTEPGIMQNAAERLLGLGLPEIQELAKEIIFGQLRLVVASMDIEEINADRDKFLANISQSVESELKKVGLKLINVNITDIVDESGYIEALGKEAAAHAINAARKSVAEKNRDGAIGEANAVQDQRTQVAAANAKAVDGENTAQIEVANSNALRRQREAEAERVAIAS